MSLGFARARRGLRALYAQYASRTARTRRRLIARRATDLPRWQDPRQLDDAGWQRRAAVAAGWIPAGSVVLDLGCGNMMLESRLPESCGYIPCDLLARDARTRICDFNGGTFPEAGGATLIAVLGVLEYLYDWEAFLARLRRYALPAILSYGVLDLTPRAAQRRRMGWVNHLSLFELLDAFERAGFEVRRCRRIDHLQFLFELF